MSAEFDFKSVQARWVLGLIRSDELPGFAAEALSAGTESKSLAELAGLTGSEADETQKLFERALSELGYRKMEKTDALKHYARTISIFILSSQIAPLDGAKRIWQATINAGVPEFHDLDGFIYAASELEDRPQDRAIFEKAIVAEASRWSKWRE